MTRQRRVLVLVAWLALLAWAAWYLAFRANMDNDLGSFLPAPETTEQQVIRHELQLGFGTRLWIIGLKDTQATSNPARLASASRAFAASLRDSGQFRQVINGEAETDGLLPGLLFRYRYLLSDSAGAFETVALEAAFQQRLVDLSMPYAPFKEELIASDPTDTFLGILQQLSTLSPASGLSSEQGIWLAENGQTAVLLAESLHAGMDYTAQLKALDAIENGIAALEAGNRLQLVLSGAPWIGMQVREKTQEASVRLTVLASALLIMLATFVYRSLPAVFIIVVPLGTALLTASAVTALWSGTLHILTLAFGITLLGVSMDYPVHALSHGRNRETLEYSVRRVWPILRIGIITTMLGFATMMWTDFPGISQLGMFSVVGLATAGLATRYVLPVFPAGRQRPGMAALEQLASREPAGRHTISVLAVILLLLALVALGWLLRADVWNDDIGALSPTPQALIEEDRRIRQQWNMAEPASMVVVWGSSREEVLQKQEAIRGRLEKAVADGRLSGYQMAAQLLPSRDSQLRRAAQLPAMTTLAPRVERAAAATGFSVGVFDEFLEAVETSRTLAPLTTESFQGTALQGFLVSLLFDLPGGSAGLVRLVGLSDGAALRATLEQSGVEGVSLLEPRRELSRSIRQFRIELAGRIALIAAVVALVVFLMLKKPGRVVKIIVSVFVSGVLALLVSILLLGSLNAISLVSLMLIAGIGIDYALFFTQPYERGEDRAATLHALGVCAVSSLIVFVLLGVSGINVLQSIGVPVSAGVLLSFVISYALGRQNAGDKHG